MGLEKIVKPHILELEPYQPGVPPEQLERELGIEGAIKLASNESPIGPSPLAVAAVREAVLVRSGQPYAPISGDGQWDLELSASLEDLMPGEEVYVRIDQDDGHTAWSSPIFVELE